jgi:hypothetical protein
MSFLGAAVFFSAHPDYDRTSPTITLPRRAVCAPPAIATSGGRP